MRLLKPFALILLFYITPHLSAQDSELKMWSKTFGGNKIDEIQSIRQTTDGGYVALGHTSSKGNGALDIWLVKIDIDGNIEWDKTFGGSNDEEGNSIRQTSDGGYIITGYTASYGNSWDVWLIKTDESGNEEWNKKYGGASIDIGYSALPTSDGGYMIAGQKYTEINQTNSDGWIIKTDSQGNIEWETLFGKSAHDFFFEVIETSDNNFVFTGATDQLTSPSDIRDLWLLKLDASGNLIWNKTFDGDGDKDFGHELQETSDGGFIVTGNIRHASGKREIWLIKTDAAGNKKWDKILSEGKDALSRSIQPCTDGGYIVSGFIDYNNTNDMDFCLIKLDNNFNKQWLKRYGESNQYEEAISGLQTKDGGFLIAGFTTLSSSNRDFFVAKTNSQGTVNTTTGIEQLSTFQLKNYPNPFNDKTTITFKIDKQSNIKLSIYNAIGQLVEILDEGIKSAGEYQYTIHSKNYFPGMYLYCLDNNNERIVRKMILTKQ